jgi:hypothetical protein
VTVPDFVSDKRTARHTLRTVVQVLLALAVAIPTAMTTLHISAALAAKITGGAGVFVIMVTAVMNALEEAGVIKTILPNPTAVTPSDDGSGDGGGDSGSAVDRPPPGDGSTVITGATIRITPLTPTAQALAANQHPGLSALPEPVPHGRLGKRRKRSDPRDFKVTRYLVRSAIGSAPGEVDYQDKVPSYGVLLNDRLGDCGIASPLHQIQTWFAVLGTAFNPTDAMALAGYEAVGGYQPGDPATDQGVYLRDMLNYWRKVGLGGSVHKILAYAAVNPTNHNLLKACISLFGGVSMGFDLPVSVQGKDHWSIGRGAAAVPGSWGGHAVPFVGYDSKHYYAVSWGRVYPVTAGFVDRYADEAWAAVSTDWLDHSGHSGTGLDLATLQADLTKV